MEKELSIVSNWGFEISGLLANQESSRLIIFVHWLSWSMTEAHYFSAKEYFTKRGFWVFRFNLYASWENYRKLETSTINDHSKDIFNVLTFFASEFQDIYLVWHSLGWPSIIGMEKFPDVLKRIVFWDPAFDTGKTVLKCFNKNEVYMYIWNGKNIEISSDMYHEFEKNNHLEILKNISYEASKMHCIYASEARHKDLIPQMENLWITTEIISWANHWFTQEGKYEELFERTLYILEK